MTNHILKENQMYKVALNLKENDVIKIGGIAYRIDRVRCSFGEAVISLYHVEPGTRDKKVTLTIDETEIFKVQKAKKT